MYRYYNKEEIAKTIRIYYDGNIPKELELKVSKIKSFFDKPTKSELIKILTNNDIDKECKMVILSALNCAINYTSIKNFLNNHAMLSSLLSNVPIKPIYTYEQAKIIVTYNITKNQNTSIYTDFQVKDVEKFLKEDKYEYTLSKSGSTDIQYETSEAGADGSFKYNNQEILLYLRYGSSTGGSQNDRYREMFKTSKLNPNRKFIFIVDGPEAVLQYNVAKKCLDDKTYENAIWSTVNLLPFINLDKMEFIK